MAGQQVPAKEQAGRSQEGSRCRDDQWVCSRHVSAETRNLKDSLIRNFHSEPEGRREVVLSGKEMTVQEPEHSSIRAGLSVEGGRGR